MSEWPPVLDSANQPWYDARVRLKVDEKVVPVAVREAARVQRATMWRMPWAFGAGVFDGTAYELGIAVRPPGTTGQFVGLQPRQPLTATPNSQQARTVSCVPDTALSSNVALLNGTPVFSAGISVTLLRVTDSTGGGLLRFGPTDDCTLGIGPAFPGLVECDPTGFRLLGQNSQGCA